MILNIEELIGSTPMIKYNDIYFKLENYNLSASSKDRAVKAIFDNISDEVKHIVLATSGNFGIACATLASIRKIKCTIFMPNNITQERIKVLKLLNAKIILTDYQKGLFFCNEEAQKYAKKSKALYIDQFSNRFSEVGNYELAKEILNTNIIFNYIICGVGSGGSYLGLYKILKEKSKKLKIIGVEPKINNNSEINEQSIPGIGAGFTSEILMDIKNESKLVIIKVTRKKAINACVELANKGLLVGISTGACFDVAKRILEKNKNANILVIVHDSIYKYLSVFDDQIV